MKFTVDKETLLKQLQLVVGVVERRQTLPVLSNVLVKLDDNCLAITGTDLEVEILSQESLSDPGLVAGETTLPARKLLDICRSLPDGALLSFSCDNQRVTIASGRSRFTLATMPANEFPSVDGAGGKLDFECPS